MVVYGKKETAMIMLVVEKVTLRKSATPAQIWRGCHPGRAELCSPALSSGGHGGACYMRGGIFLCVTSVIVLHTTYIRSTQKCCQQNFEGYFVRPDFWAKVALSGPK